MNFYGKSDNSLANSNSITNSVFHSVVDLQEAINRLFVEHNGTEAKPFNWTADPDKIIAAVKRGHQVLDSNH